ANPAGDADALGCPVDRTPVAAIPSGTTPGDGMRRAPGRRGVEGARSVDRDASAFPRSNAGPGPPPSGSCGGWPVDAVGGLLSSGSGWNVDRLHELQGHSRDVLVPGRREVATGDGPAAAVAHGRPALDLSAVKVAMDRREFDRATALLDRTLDTPPDAPEALALIGRLLECRGLDHAAYHEYRRALALDPENIDARAGMRRYCARFGLDGDDPRINPAAGR